MQLRVKGATHTAVRVDVRTRVDDLIAHPGDWLVLNLRGIAIAVVSAKTFPGAYEILEPGILTLTPADRATLEETTGIGTTRTAIELIQAVRRLARISIGEVVIPFTPGQLEELKHRATKRGQTVQQAIEAVVDRIKDEIFWKG